jgi:putative colanic acid biosynthesis UDP-glucose lipid carrier transferase
MNFVSRPKIDFVEAGGVVARDLNRIVSGKPAKWPIRYEWIETLAIVFDVATIVSASVCASVLYQLSEGLRVELGQPLGSAVLVAVLFSLVLKSQGRYNPSELLIWRRQVRLIFAAWAGVFLLLAGIVFALKIGSELSRGTNILFAAFSIVGLIANRTIIRELLKKGLSEHRFSGRKVALIVDTAHGYEPISRRLCEVGLDVSTTFALPSRGASSNLRRRLARDVIEHIRGSDIEEVIVTADLSRWSEIRAFAGELRLLPFPITIVPTGAATDILHRPRCDLSTTARVELQRGPLSHTEHLAKRAIDLIGASAVLVLLAPLLILVAMAIKLDSPGPVLFRQQRLGFNGRGFRICKFRTMSTLEDGFSAVQARPADDRITRVGRWLRKTSIDELPQLFNVLGGSMSLVGPRPHAVAHDNHFDKLVRNYAFRQRVKPGLTGWAQVHGFRGPTPTTQHIEQRVGYDLWYIDNWRLRLDFVILLQTPLEVLRARNAY